MICFSSKKKTERLESFSMFTEVPAATRLPADRLEPFDSEMDDSQSEMNHGIIFKFR